MAPARGLGSHGSKAVPSFQVKGRRGISSKYSTTPSKTKPAVSDNSKKSILKTNTIPSFSSGGFVFNSVEFTKDPPVTTYQTNSIPSITWYNSSTKRVSYHKYIYPLFR